jgi:hypothetical protein
MNFNLGKVLGYFLALVLIGLLIWVIVKQVEEYKLENDPILHTLKQVLRPILIENNIANLKLYKGSKSFTINKDQIFLCVKDENGQYYPLNMLIYVLLHEIAHRINHVDVGHTDAFYAKFDELLDRATELGIYNPSIPVINNYCNHT